MTIESNVLLEVSDTPAVKHGYIQRIEIRLLLILDVQQWGMWEPRQLEIKANLNETLGSTWFEGSDHFNEKNSLTIKKKKHFWLMPAE